jgi:lipopolysaccharide biosynthesis glycosyltransferase
MAMTREQTIPFFHEYESLSYTWRDNSYTVRMPFPIWTFNSGSVVFNLEKLRKRDYIHNFLAFSAQNAGRIGNLDQSLLNYFFGKRITKIDGCWNHPPYRGNTVEQARIVHFHGPKPWDVRRSCYKDLRINDYERMRSMWKSWLRPEEAALVAGWEADN